MCVILSELVFEVVSIVMHLYFPFGSDKFEWEDTSLRVKYFFLYLFFSDYIAMYGPVYWERNKIQVHL